MSLVNRRRNVSLTFALALLALPLPVLGQARPRPKTASPKVLPSGAADDQQLATLLTIQQAATRIGEAPAIEAATRLLAAYALRQLAQLRLVQGQPGEAAQLQRKSLALEDQAETRLELASILLRSGHPREAADETLLVLGSNQANAVAWAIRGSALRALGDDTPAADAFNRSLKLQPSINVAFALASSLLAIHEEARAQAVFSQIFAATDDAAIQHVAAGDAYLEARYLNQAAAEFSKALAKDPKAPHAEFFLGFTYLQMNEWGPNSQSFEHLRAAVRLAPRDYLSNFYLGAIESTDGTDLASSNRHLHVAAEADPHSPEVFLYLGLNAVHEKDTASAKTYLRKAVELTGSDEARNNYQIRRVYAVLGRILVSEGNHAEGDALLAKYRSSEHSAIGNSSAVIARAAGQEDAHASPGGLPAAKLEFPGMNSAAIPAPLPASALAPSPGPTHTEAETRQIAATATQLSQLLATTLNDLGTAEARQGKYAVALAHFREAALWQPPTPALERNTGVAAFRVKDFAESARALTSYFALQPPGSPADEHARTMLAMSQFALANYGQARQAFALVPAATMLDPRAAYSWAYALAHDGQQQRANEVTSELLKQPLPSNVRSLVCHIYMDTESYEQSLACYQAALLADPQLKMAHYQAAESLIRLDRPAEAVAELRKELAAEPATPDNPNNPDVQYSLAFALLQNSQRAEATSLLQSLIAAHPTHAQGQYQFGKLLLEEGKPAEAVEHLEAAEKGAAEADYVHYQLQAAYRKVGRTQDADRELQLYRTLKQQSRNATPPISPEPTAQKP